MYSARQDIQALTANSNIRWMGGKIVKALIQDGDHWLIHGTERAGGAPFSLRTRKVLLAAGALASARLALATLNWRERPIRLLSTPMTAFAVWLPKKFGMTHKNSFGLAQLSFVVNDQNHGQFFGSLFSTSGLPVSEFVLHAPLGKRFTLDLFRGLMSSMIVGNCFLPSLLSRHEMVLEADGSLLVRGGFAPEITTALTGLRQRLVKSFRRLGALVLPGGFMLGLPGADVHYAGTVPMRAQPKPNEANSLGEVAGLPGVYVVDGAALSTLPTKSHTLTIMANADRISRELVKCL
jgi:hypothetical protein